MNNLYQAVKEELLSGIKTFTDEQLIQTISILTDSDLERLELELMLTNRETYKRVRDVLPEIKTKKRIQKLVLHKSAIVKEFKTAIKRSSMDGLKYLSQLSIPQLSQVKSYYLEITDPADVSHVHHLIDIIDSIVKQKDSIRKPRY